jgi:hypothetical protein
VLTSQQTDQLTGRKAAESPEKNFRITGKEVAD